MDYQASTPTDSRVVDAMMPFFSDVFGNPSSSEHAFGWEAASAVERARSQLAELIGAYTEEVFFTSGATESNNHVFHAVSGSVYSNRKTLLVSAIEHPCVLQSAALAAERNGLQIVTIPVDRKGTIDREFLVKNLTDDVLMVSVMAVNNEVGTLQDIKGLVDLTHASGALFHCDAAQAFPAMSIDVSEWDVDFMSFSAHKMYGPKGIGGLYVRSDLKAVFPALLVGGEQQEGVRAGTVPVPLCVGFGMAASIMSQIKDSEVVSLQNLKALFISELIKKNISFDINGFTDLRGHPGNLSVTFKNIDGQHLLGKLQPGLAASTGSACSSGMLQHSHVLSALGLNASSARRTVRFGLGRYTDEQQVVDAVNLISNVIQNLEI